MEARFSVYCNHAVSNVTPHEILKGVKDADQHTITEFTDVHDEYIESALDQLQLEGDDEHGFRQFRLCFGPTGCRQIDVERCKSSHEVQETVTELLDMVKQKNGPFESRISTHLTDSVDIVYISFFPSPDDMMTPILAPEVVRWFAHKFDGLIRATDDSLWQCHNNKFYRLQT